MFKRILFYYDGSEDSRRALIRSAELATLVGANVRVLSIVPESVSRGRSFSHATGYICADDIEHSYREMLNEAIELLKSLGVPAEGHLARGNVVESIIAYCKQLAIDVVVLGRYPHVSAGRWHFERQQAFLAERAKCCVLIVSGESEKPDSPASG